MIIWGSDYCFKTHWIIVNLSFKLKQSKFCTPYFVDCTMPHVTMMPVVKMCVVAYPKQNLWSGPLLELTHAYCHLRASPIPVRTLLEDCSPNRRSPFQSHKNLQGITHKLEQPPTHKFSSFTHFLF